MSGQLVGAGDGAPVPCRQCGAPAVGPCARCRAMVCGDCCTLTEGGANTFAICTRCERRGGATLRPHWVSLGIWLALLILAIGGLAAILLLARA